MFIGGWVDEWIKKEVVAYVCVCVCVYAIKYYSAIKNEEILPFVTTMLSEISQMEKDKYCMISLICGI